MAFGTHIGMHAAGGNPGDEEINHLKLMNARPGTARALARTVRDVINWRGQSRHFLDRAKELEDLPPTALYWGDRDQVIPLTHALEMESLIDGATMTRFNEFAQSQHHESPMTMV